MMMNTGIWASKRQTRRQRVDLVLLVELHHLFVELGAVVAVLGLQLAHLRRQPLHLEHPLGALQRQRRGDHHHDDCDQGDRRGVAVGEAVEPGEQPRRQVEHSGSDHRRSVLVSTAVGNRRRRHRVVAVRAERAAAQQPAKRQPGPPPAPVDQVRLPGVRRTRRREAARRRATGACLLVPVDQRERPAISAVGGHRRGWR